jgi:hypothetical protein
MKTRKIALVLMLFVVFAATVVPTLAADKTLTFTEDEINSAYLITNTPRRIVTDAAVDLQPGQAVVNLTVTLRGRDPLAVSGTVVPSVNNGRIYWSVTTASVDGTTVSDALLTQINTAISSAWRNYVRGKLPTGRVTAITLSDTDVQISYQER